MANIFRKIQRNQLKKQHNTNKIKDIFHEENDTLEQKLRKEFKNGNNVQKNK